MSPAAANQPFGNVPTVAKPPAWAGEWHKPVFITFLIGLALYAATVFLRLEPSPEWAWLKGLFWLLAAATSLVNLAKRLPAQSVFTVFLIMGTASATIHLIGSRTGIPFGPVIYTENLGPRVLESLPWMLPFIWIVVLINGRGVARLIMRPWRKTTYYGFWVIGLTTVLAVGFDLALEPFATQSQHFWAWDKMMRVGKWYATPWVNFLGWALTAVSVMGFATPWLINKQPIKQPTDFHPLIIWLGVQALLLGACALNGQWLAVGVVAAINAVATFFAFRGARW